MSKLAFAYGGPVCDVQFKQQPRDFKVSEILSFEPDGEGHHWLVEVEKIDINTLDLLQQLATHLKVPRRSVGYSGLKDRHAVCRQWLTIPNQTVDLAALKSAAGRHWRVLRAERHRRKLRVGSHRNNQFCITLREISMSKSNLEHVEQRLQLIAAKGVPNYFGPQRFGNDGSNLRKAWALFEEGQKLARQQHRFAVSAARSMLFNLVLSQRVSQHCWDRFIDGDVVMLEGSRSWFELERLGDDGDERLLQQDVHPSGPLWGQGDTPTHQQAAIIENEIAENFSSIASGLAKLGLKQERRALRLHVTGVHSQWCEKDHSLELVFNLPKGGFATSVLRELFCHPQLDFNWPERIKSQLASNT